MTPRASALLVRTLNQEMMVSDFCPEIYCTGYRNKATELDLFPLRTPVAKSFPHTPSGGSAAGDIPLQSEVLELMLQHESSRSWSPAHSKSKTQISMDQDSLTSLTSVFSLLISLMKQLLSWQIQEHFACFGQCPIFSGYECPNCKKRHAAMFVPVDSDLGFVQLLPWPHFQWQA